MSQTTNATHDPNLTSWVESANEPQTDFPIQNLPLCIFHGAKEDPEDARVGVAIGDHVLDLAGCCEAGLLDEIDTDDDSPLIEDLAEPALNVLMCSAPERWSALRGRVSVLLSTTNKELRDSKKLRDSLLHAMERCVFLPPTDVGDYTDYYASVHHATNVGSMFRPDNPLLPNYKWIPIGYHGRASSIVVSGTPVRRPKGQTMADDADAPVYAPCKLLDYELEVGFFVGAGNELGDVIGIDEAPQHIFGMTLVNDWSARDMQKWEYQPLGPFLAKSFATSVSPFVVMMEALAPFRCPAFERAAGDPAPLPHLRGAEDQRSGGVDLTLEVFLSSERMRAQRMDPVRLSVGSFRHMYWTIAQMLTHHASNGCNLQPGDLMASGTVSGPEPGARGCLLELTWDGPGKPRRPIQLPTGESRTFLADGDEVILRGFCEREGRRRIGFGACRGIVLPAEG